MEDFNLTSVVNSSLLRMRDVTSTEPAVVAVRNATVTSNAYEWRFILPPYILIFLLSISGNCLVIATLASNRRMRTVTNVYLLNLAISDFLLGVFCLPFTLVGQIYRRFLFGAVLCKLIPFLQAVSVSVDVWTLVAISLERYFAICRPLKSRKWQTQCHAYKMIAVVWVLSIALNWPILIVSKLQPMRGNAFKCREVWTSLELERAFNLGLDVALLLVPFFIMSFAYCLIVTKLWRGMRHEIQHSFNWQRHLAGQSSMKNSHLLSSTPILQANSSEICCKNWTTKKETEPDMGDLKQPQSYCMHTVDMEFRHVVRSTHTDKSIEAKRKVIRMLFVIILEFFVCWTPLHVINTIYLFYPEELYHYIGSKGIVCLQLLAYCASCCNPITYCFMNRKFRLAFITLLKTCRIFRGCFSEKLECKQATPPPSSQDVTACIVRGSHTGRTVSADWDDFVHVSRFTFEEDLRMRLKHVGLHLTSYIWRCWKERIVFSSGSSTALGSGAHPALPAPVVTRPVTQELKYRFRKRSIPGFAGYCRCSARHTGHRNRRRRKPVPLPHHLGKNGTIKRNSILTATL